MEFNKLIRNPKRQENTEEKLHEILDEGFLCHVGFSFEGNAMIIPTAYGRKENEIYFHGAASNFMLNQACNGQTICVTVTHLDGIVAAKNLFHSSANYRSVVLFGKAEPIEDDEEKMEALKIISDQVLSGRTQEVNLGTPEQIRKTMVIRFTISNASVKVRAGGPMGDEEDETTIWSGVIPLALRPLTPEFDPKRTDNVPYSPSVEKYISRYSSR